MPTATSPSVLPRPTGSDPLVETAWDLCSARRPRRACRAPAAKIRLRVNVGKGPQRLLADDIRLEAKRPPPFHRAALGWADIHCHPMAQAGFGDLLAGHMHGPVEDLGSCPGFTGTSTAICCRPTAFALGEHAHNDGAARNDRLEDPDARPHAQLGFNGWPDLRRDHPHQDAPGLDPPRL